jgi:hypothetical protein
MSNCRALVLSSNEKTIYLSEYSTGILVVNVTNITVKNNLELNENF